MTTHRAILPISEFRCVARRCINWREHCARHNVAMQKGRPVADASLGGAFHLLAMCPQYLPMDHRAEEQKRRVHPPIGSVGDGGESSFHAATVDPTRHAD